MSSKDGADSICAKEEEHSRYGSPGATSRSLAELRRQISAGPAQEGPPALPPLPLAPPPADTAWTRLGQAESFWVQLPNAQEFVKQGPVKQEPVIERKGFVDAGVQVEMEGVGQETRLGSLSSSFTLTTIRLAST